MTNDLLAAINRGEVSPDRAEDLAEELTASDHGGNLRGLMGLSQIEYTAYAHGTPLAVLARWRLEGIPELCGVCSKGITPASPGGWLAREVGGSYALVHIACLPLLPLIKQGLDPDDRSRE